MSARKISMLGLLTASALALTYIESFIPVPFPVAGAKLGLANIVAVFTLVEFGLKEAALVQFMRILLAGFMFGSVSSIVYALSGALLSLLVMALALKLSFGVLVTSVMGGIAHNAGQLTAACLATDTWKLFLSYGPILFIIGSLTGLFVGLCSLALLKIYPKTLK